MEELLAEVEEKSHNRAEYKREDDLKHRLDEHRGDADAACRAKSLCHSEGDGEEHEAYRIVKSNDGQKNIGERALCLILTDNHQGCGRGGSRRDRAENYSGGKRKLVGLCEMEADQSRINEEGGYHRLKNADDRRLLAYLLQL